MIEAWAAVGDGVVIDGRDPHRVVPWWSFTKTAIAAAALVLVRDGILNLDEPLEGKPYTLRHLLQHQSGLADYGSCPAYHQAVARGDEPWAVSALLAHVDADRLRYTTGQGWDYSNIGYLVVRQLIEAGIGERLGDALRRLVLHPLGLGNVRFASEHADLNGVAMGRAASYHPGWVYHGLLVGSAADAAILLHRLMTGPLLPPNLLSDMLKPHMLPGPVSGRPWVAPGYGLGIMTGEGSRRMKVAGHTGGGPGSTIAVYTSLDSCPRRTAAFFTTSGELGRTEENSFELLRG